MCDDLLFVMKLVRTVLFSVGRSFQGGWAKVNAGHWVGVAPTALPDPELVACAPSVAELIGLDPGECRSEQFLAVFSGASGLKKGGDAGVTGWATPYGISIYGEEIVPPGAGPRGDGYGDGRAISIAEVIAPGGATARYELQLKV